jgi:enoyl-CoA hydratase
LLDAGVEIASEIAQRSPLAVANAKYVMNSAWADGTGVDAGLRLERERTAYYCLTSEDAREGLRAFAEKRAPRFTGS